MKKKDKRKNKKKKSTLRETIPTSFIDQLLVMLIVIWICSSAFLF